MWAISLLSYFIIVHLHYAMIAIFIKTWNLWSIFYMVVSYLFFFPFFQFVADLMSGPTQYRLTEIAYSNGYFWQIVVFFVLLLILPIVASFRAKELFRPSPKELLTNRLTSIEQIERMLTE